MFVGRNNLTLYQIIDDLFPTEPINRHFNFMDASLYEFFYLLIATAFPFCSNILYISIIVVYALKPRARHAL